MRAFRITGLLAVCLALVSTATGAQTRAELNAQLGQLKKQGFDESSAEVRAVGEAYAALPAPVGPPPNDTCATAIQVACGSVTAGSTVGASSETQPFCGTTDGTDGAVWYEITGAPGEMVTATTCSPNTDFDTKLRVYDGTCAGLNCIVGNDDDPSCQADSLHSTVMWQSVGATPYHILVHGFDIEEGNFELTITCLIPAELIGFEVE